MKEKSIIRSFTYAALAATGLVASAAAQQPAAAPDPAPDAATAKPAVERLEDGRYRIGPIVVDKEARRFEVPARVNRLEPPLEYLAVSRGGYKAYESLLELKSSAVEFNLACILIGLDAESADLPRYQFDTEPVAGQRVRLEARWRAGDQTVSVPAGHLLAVNGKPAAGPWIYIGSRTESDGRFHAEEIGSVIGFVHDPASILEHAAGLGIGAYGAVQANPEQAPAVDTEILLVVSAGPPAGE